MNLKRYFIIAGIISCFFALLVAKDISLPPLLIIILGFVGLGFIFFRGMDKPQIPLLILTCYIPFSKILVGDFGTNFRALNFTNILTIIILIGWFLKSQRENLPFWEESPLNKLIYLFIFLGFLSVVHAFGWVGENAFLIFIDFKRWVTPIIFFFLAYNIVRDKNVCKAVIYTMTFVIFLAGVMAIRDYMNFGVSASSLEKARIGGITAQPNQLAAFFVYYMFLYAGFILTYYNNFRSWLLLLPMAVAFRGIMVTFSRGGYVAFACGGLGLSFFRSKLLFILSTAGLVFMIMNPQFLPAGIRYRMNMTIEEKDYVSSELEENLEPSSARRIEAWRGGIAMIKDKPLFGVGYGLFPYFLPRYNPNIQEMDAHNSYLIIAAEQGLPTLIVFLSIVFLLFRYSNWVYRNTKDKFYKAVSLGFLGGLSGLLVANIFGSRLNSTEISGYFWILAGIIMRIYRNEIQ
ncbi:MAG: O-antigen ligase family protein [Candidatus Omnitrophica bacterium]|nr:O-antigen ligase family protein [Candidatus Omnitrophota bacterium]